MNRLFILLVSFLLIACSSSDTSEQKGVIFQLHSPAPHYSDKTNIYIAGNFNAWKPNDSSFLMKSKGNDLFEFQLMLSGKPKGTFEYKYTLGSWAKAEADSQGGNIENRKIKYTGGLVTIQDTISSWSLKPPKSSATNNVSIYREAIEIPQLQRKRRIWMYLPSDYQQTDKRYPVIYMHDAQNLFDSQEMPYGEWEVDETLNKFEKKYGFSAIVVGIEHADSLRLQEYSPYPHPKYVGGDGEEYLAFLVETLKPMIDREFRTLADRENTAIAGSSMGGLISFCAGVEYPEIFSKLFVFSPSFWFHDQVYDDAEKLVKADKMKIYLLVGTKEGPSMVNGVKKMQAILESSGKFSNQNLVTLFIKGRKHNERFWRKEFPKALSWFFDLEKNVEKK